MIIANNTIPIPAARPLPVSDLARPLNTSKPKPLPPIIRLTSLGLTQVSGTYSEVSRSFGGTLIQTLNKVKFPLAIPSLVIGFNQTVIMAFAMQIVTPLIGGKGLGLEVFNGLARSDTGRGLAAGIGIVLLAIIIDRITLAWTKKQREALGLIS